MNKNVKKFFSVFLCVIMIFSLFAVTSFSEESHQTSIEAKLTEDIVLPDTEFLICISVKNATELSGMDIDIKFDNEYIECVDMEDNINIPDMSSNCNYWGDGHAQFECTFDNGSFSGSDEIFYVSFQARSEGEYTINLNINSWQGKNKPENTTFSFYVGDPDNKTEYKGLTYEIKDNEVTIIDCIEEYKGRLDIPAEIDGYPVTAVAEGAFFGCGKITSISIPATITKVDIGTISNNSELEKIIVDENNQYYSSDEHGVLFDKSKSKLIRYPVANSATEYKIPDSVTTICEYAFARAKKLTSITIPGSVTTIEAVAFLATWNLEHIIIPDSVTKLTGNAFSNSGIKSAVLPTGINTIETRLFDKCTKLESVVIPANITHIDDFAFSMCDKLKNVYFTGSQEEWNKITISDVQNSVLTDAAIHFNYDGVIMYDVNGDGNINAADARIALRVSAKLEVLEGNRFNAADIDKDGKITAADARLILRKSAKLD